jgi:membrane protease YdiL (CAAX protease family)
LNRRWLAFSRFFLGIAVVLAANLMAGSFVPRDLAFLRSNLVYRPLALVFLLIGFSIVVRAFDRVRGNPLAAIGLAIRRPWLRDLWIGGVLGAGMLAVTVSMIAFTGGLSITLNTGQDAVMRAVVVMIILAAGAMAEEISFRGYPFQRLVAAVGAGPAVAVLSILFGTAHLLNPDASAWGFLNTVLIGILLAVAYLRTGSLWMPIAIHFWWNTTLGLIFGLPVSGLWGFSVVTKGRLRGPLWLTGGGYGIEASAVTAGVIVAGIVALVAFVPSRKARCLPGAIENRELPASGGISEESHMLPGSSVEQRKSGLALPSGDSSVQPKLEDFSES